ncbi:pertactin-like passenger domain-containing protein, partial [Candidatus Williamhamiltonella defendens]|uniref:pertactin-like passenger domain-containing protein n=1 Tax=Candidatus Williamhamiltonella defendens TaxID=138072 RepID=UPI001581C3B9
MMALSGATISVQDSTITTQGKATGFQGFYAEGENTTISADKMNIITEGKDSYGVRALNGATLHIKGSTIITRGASSPALWSKASTLKISDSYLKTTETDSAILHVAAENTKKRKSLVEITKGYLNASGDIIVSQGGEMDVILNNVGMSSPGSGYILKVIEKGEVNLVLNQIKGTEKELQGNIFADPFSKADVTLKGGSQLSGNINATSLFIDPDSTWSFTRNSVLKHLSHEGNMTFKFHNDTPWNKKTKEDYSKLSLETLSGRGTFWMNTDIAGHQGDFLDVTGEANGQFDVMVTDSGRSPTSEDSLKIIQTGGGTAEFTLANPGKVVEIGTYQYFLVPDKIKRGWSLVPHPPETETPQKLDVNTSFTEKIASEKTVSDATVPLEGTQEAPLPGSPDKAPSAREISSTLHSTASSTEPVTAKTEVSGETVTPHVTQETKPGNPYQSVKKKVNAKSPAVTRPISSSTAAVLSMSTVGPLIYHSEMAQIQERMSETRQAKTEDTVWV